MESTYKLVEVEIEEGGAITTEPYLRQSAPEGGCGTGRCQCSPGHWLSLSDGEHVFVVHFESREALEAALHT